MLNRAPIFVNGFSRGGTTIFTNLLASHPDVCTVPEIHHLFKGHNVSDSALRILRKCLFHDAPVILRLRQDFFSPRLMAPRRPLSRRLQHFIDRVINKEKLRCRQSIFNEFKHQGVYYTKDEVTSSRVVAKCIDGMIYASDEFAKMYPDATFVGLVRHGLALCEGHLRRGRSAQKIGQRYRQLGEKMLEDARRYPRYRIYRFEDLLEDPTTCLADLYDHADLDESTLSGVRMQVRRVMDAQGNHKLVGGSEWDVVWLELNALNSYFRSDVNSNQIKRLSAADRDAFLREAGPTMKKLGYDPDAASAMEPQIIKIGDNDQKPPMRSAA
jgi:hypothetical protein